MSHNMPSPVPARPGLIAVSAISASTSQVPRKKDEHPNRVNCYDPATMEYLGFVPALNAESVSLPWLP